MKRVLVLNKYNNKKSLDITDNIKQPPIKQEQLVRHIKDKMQLHMRRYYIKT